MVSTTALTLDGLFDRALVAGYAELVATAGPRSRLVAESLIVSQEWVLRAGQGSSQRCFGAARGATGVPVALICCWQVCLPLSGPGWSSFGLQGLRAQRLQVFATRQWV